MPLEIPAGIIVTLLTLLFTLVIGLITVIALVLGWSFYKRYDQVQQEYHDIKYQLGDAEHKYKEIMVTYSAVKKELEKITEEPERRSAREFLDTVLECLQQNETQKLNKMTDDISVAMLNISETGHLHDAMRIFGILDYAIKLQIPKLLEHAQLALRRIAHQCQEELRSRHDGRIQNRLPGE